MLYAAILRKVGKLLIARQNPPIVSASAFLWRDYEPQYYNWEILELLRRTALTGWVLLISERRRFLRLVVGLLVSIVGAVAILTSQPYQRNEDDMLGVTCQLLLVCVFVGAILVQLYGFFYHLGLTYVPASAVLGSFAASDAVEQANATGPTQKLHLGSMQAAKFAESYLGFDSDTTIVTTMLVFSFSVLMVVFASTLYRVIVDGYVPQLRLLSTKRKPVVMPPTASHYHLFVSHSQCSPATHTDVAQAQRRRRRLCSERPHPVYARACGSVGGRTGHGRSDQAPAPASAPRR